MSIFPGAIHLLEAFCFLMILNNGESAHVNSPSLCFEQGDYLLRVNYGKIMSKHSERRCVYV